MKFKDLREKLIKEDKLFKEGYLKEDLAFGISRLISNVRTFEGLDQTKLAKLVKTKQSGISRLERGSSLPSLTFISKVAKVLDYKVELRFVSNKTNSVFDSNGLITISNQNYAEKVPPVNYRSNTNSHSVVGDVKSSFSVRDNQLVYS